MLIAFGAILLNFEQPVTLAADPPADRDEAQGSDLLRDIRRKTKPILATMAKDHGYRLTDEEDVHVVRPPFDPIRAEYYRIGHPGQANAIHAPPTAMLFHWSDRDGGLENWGMSFGGYSLRSLIDAVAGIKDQMIEGPDEILNQTLKGDWVVRVGTKDFQIIKQLETILRNELSLPIHLELREVERSVFVVKGKYKFKPLAGQPDRQEVTLTDKTLQTDPIQIFGKELAPNGNGGGGTGKFDELLNWVGRWIEVPIVSDIQDPPHSDFSWFLHERMPSTKASRAEDHDPKLVMANFAAQTGLAVTEEVRPVRILFVTRD